MKITSASKKVLASALSAAMVVAFAPAVAFGTPTGSIATKECDDAAMAALGYVAKVFNPTASTGNPIGYKYYTAADMTTVQNYILISDIVVDGTTLVTLNLADGAVIDMAGHTIKASADNVNPVTAAGDLTVKNGTIEATGKGSVAIVDGVATGVGSAKAVKLTDVSVTGKEAALDGNNNLSIKNGTYGKITATSVAVDGTVETKEIAGAVNMAKNASLTVVAENAGEHFYNSATDKDTHADGTSCANAGAAIAANTAKGIDGKLTMDEGATATVTAASKMGKAYGITRGYEGAKNATVNVTAIANEANMDAYGIDNGADSQDGTYKWYENSVINVTAKSAGQAIAINGATVMNAVTVVAEGKSDADSKAVVNAGDVTIAGGSFTGYVDATKTKGNITGGTFSKDPSDYVTTTGAGAYDVSKNSEGMYAVVKFQGFNIAASGCNAEVADYVNAAAQAMVKGETPAGIKLAEGVTPEAFVKACTDQAVKVVAKVADYNEKTATDAQKAAKEAMDADLKANLGKLVTPNTYKTLTITIQYNKTGQIAPVVLGTVTELGQIAYGMSTKQATLDIDWNDNGAEDVIATDPYVEAVTSGKAAKQAWKKNLAGQPVDIVQFTTIPELYALATIDTEAVKNAAEKGEQAAETITDPAVMAAIAQLQDQNAVLQVEGKSKTVKKGKSATIKLGVAPSASGAKVTFKKANTAGKKNITVSKAGTVTVKKALKKGTYNVKVKATCGASFKNVVVKIVKK